jgi:hypothetical protein
MGVTKNDTIKTHCDYYSVLGWFLDCWTGLLKNILIYIDLVHYTLLRMKRKDPSNK